MNESRRTSLDIMTIIASFLVVLTHQASQVDARSIYVYQIISEAAVPLFIMKSGTLQLSNSKRIDYSYVRKRITKFALIITFWGLFYNLLCNALIDGISYSAVWKSIVAVVTADTAYNYQFWYLYMLLGLYIISPVIKKFTDNAGKKDFLYVITIFAIIGFIVPFICGIYDVDSQSIWVVKWLSPFSAYWLLYYLLGTYLDRYPLSKQQNQVIILLTALLGSLTILKCVGGDNSQDSLKVWLKYNSPFTLVYTVALFSVVYRKCDSCGARRIAGLAKYSLGIYILHPAIIVAMRKVLGIDVSCFALVMSVPVLTCVVYICCAIATWVFKKIPILRGII